MATLVLGKDKGWAEMSDGEKKAAGHYIAREALASGQQQARAAAEVAAAAFESRERGTSKLTKFDQSVKALARFQPKSAKPSVMALYLRLSATEQMQAAWLRRS